MSPQSETARAVILMTAAMAAFTVNDACMKAVTATLPLYQTIFLRNLVAAAAIAIIAYRTGGLRLRLPGRDARYVGLRLVGEVGSTLTFLTALKHMPLASLSAIMQSMPLAVVMAAALFLGERIGWRRLTAIGIGFAGVLLIVRPGTEGFDRWSVLGLVCVGFVVLRDLSTRNISARVSSQTVAFFAATSVTVAAGLAVPFTGWESPTGAEALLIMGAAAFLILGYLTVVGATRGGDIGTVAPFRYTALIFAILLGFAVFGDLPDAMTLAGSALIVASGLYALYRSRRLSARPPADADQPPPA
ncbi:MAG: DMT family transporter [Paracoccaceae bacterium]